MQSSNDHTKNRHRFDKLVASDSDLESGTDGKRQAGIADGANMLLAEQVVELGEDGYVVGGDEEGVHVEFGVAEVQIKIGEQEGVAAVDVVVELEGGVVAAAGESAFEGCGEAAGCVFDGEEAGAWRAAEGAAAYERRKRADGDAGQVGVGGGCAIVGGDGVAREGLLDERGEVGVAAV